MAESQIIHCPQCRAKLALKASSRVGDRVRCSYCDGPFVIDSLGDDAQASSLAQAASPGEDVLSRSPMQHRTRKPVEYDSEYAEYDQLEEVVVQSPDVEAYSDSGGAYWTSFDDLATKPKRVKKTADDESVVKRKKSPAPWVIPVLTVFGIICATSLLGAVLFYGIVSPKIHAGNLDLTYLPPDSELIIAMRVDTTWNSEFVQGLMKKPRLKRAFDLWDFRARKSPGDSMDDLKSLTIGFSGIGNPRLGGIDPSMAETIIVMRSNKRIDTGDARHFGDKKRYNGTTYYSGKHGNVAGFAFFFPDSRTMVMGTPASLFAAIDRGKQTFARPELDYVDTSRHAMMIYTPKDPSVFDVPDNQFNPNQVEPLRRFTNVVENRLKSVCVGVTFLKDVHVQIQGNCSDMGSAVELREGMDQLLSELSVQLDEAKQILPEELVPVARQGEVVLESAKTTLDDNTVSLTATIPANSFSAFADFPQALPLLMAHQGEPDDANPAPLEPVVPDHNNPNDRIDPVRNEPFESNVAQNGAPAGIGEEASADPQDVNPDPGNLKTVWLVEFELINFSGEGTQFSAARQVLKQFPEIPPPSINVVAGRNLIRCIVRGKKPDPKPMKKALQSTGFAIGQVTVR